MSSKWKTVVLEDALDELIDYRGKTPKKSESGIPLITAKIVKNGRIETPAEFISEDIYDDWMQRGLPEKGDVVMTTEAPLGEIAQLYSANVALAQRIVTLRGKKGLLNNDYLLYLMQSDFIQHQLEARASGSTVRGIKQSELRKIDLLIPSLEEQKEIANQLKTIDQKIHLNQQTNETLEAMAQAIFKSWFEDFDPVRAKIEATSAGRDPNRAAMAAIAGISSFAKASEDKSSSRDWDEIEASLDQKLDRMSEAQQHQLTHTAQLFPDELVDSEIGEVPKGWGISKLEDYMTLSYGKGLRKKDREEGSVLVYGSGGLTGTHNKSLIDGPGIIVGRKGTVGSIYWEDRDFWPIDTVFYVEPKKDVDLSFYYYLLNTLGLHEMNTDAAVPGLNRKNAYRLQIPEFPEKLMKEFADFTADLHKMMRVKKAEKKTLENVRDTLLPKLISGKLQI